MRKFLALSSLTLGLLACDDKSTGGASTSPTTNPGATSNGDGTLQGAYKTTEAVKGEYQTLFFGPGNQVVYKREAGSCVTEQDTGTGGLVTEAGMVGLEVELARGVGEDGSFSGAGCAPLVKLSSSNIMIFGGPYVFRWVTPGTTFEIQVTETRWMRFSKI